MATTTARGFRKPQTTDKVKDGATAIANLADDVDSKVGLIRHGRATVNALVTGTPVLQAVNFGTAFPAGTVPDVAGQLRSTVPQNFDVGVANESATGFDLYVTRRAGATASVTFGYIAAG